MARSMSACRGARPIVQSRPPQKVNATLVDAEFMLELFEGDAFGFRVEKQHYKEL